MTVSVNVMFDTRFEKLKIFTHHIYILIYAYTGNVQCVVCSVSKRGFPRRMQKKRRYNRWMSKMKKGSAFDATLLLMV